MECGSHEKSALWKVNWFQSEAPPGTIGRTDACRYELVKLESTQKFWGLHRGCGFENSLGKWNPRQRPMCLLLTTQSSFSWPLPQLVSRRRKLKFSQHVFCKFFFFHWMIRLPPTEARNAPGALCRRVLRGRQIFDVFRAQEVSSQAVRLIRAYASKNQFLIPTFPCPRPDACVRPAGPHPIEQKRWFRDAAHSAKARHKATTLRS